MNPSEILKRKRNEILDTANKYGITNLRIFGSVARGEDDDNSDLDLLASFPQGFDLFNHAALILELEDLLGIKVDVISENGLKTRIKDRVLNEAVPV